jgi:hypothetical protein
MESKGGESRNERMMMVKYRKRIEKNKNKRY